MTGGVCHVVFDEDIARNISETAPVIVTVTPLGDTRCVYISESSSRGFTVRENSSGTSNVDLAWISMAKRNTIAEHRPPAEVLNKDKMDKLSRSASYSEDNAENNPLKMSFTGGELLLENTPSKPRPEPQPKPEQQHRDTGLNNRD
jgi:hypothetical protein